MSGSNILKQNNSNICTRMNMITSALFVAAAIFALCEAGIVDTLEKCSIKDQECQKLLYESTMRAVAETGDPDLGIPVLDPIELKDITVSVLGLMDITMVEGVAEGVKGVKLEAYETDYEKGITLLDIYFDELTVRGHYTVKSAPLIEQVLGNVVTGDGNGKVVMEKLRMKYRFEFKVEKRSDGEIYLAPDFDKTKYKFDIGKTTFDADNILLGSQDISARAVSFLNQNSNHVMTTFGKLFSDKGVEIQSKYLQKFFSSVPTKNYLIEEMTPFVKS